MRGIDIYHNESINESSELKSVPEKAYKESDFVIVKSTQGTSYKYTSFFYKMIDRTLKDNKLAGAYHYAGGHDPIAEADYFIAVVKNYIGKIVLCLDWEGNQNSQFGSKTWCTKFIDRVKEKTGVTCFLYTGSDGCNQNITLADKVPLWFAGYPKPMSTNWDVPKWKYNLGKWGKPAIWQYTSTNEKCDRNTTNLTKQQWLNYTKGKTIEQTNKQTVSKTETKKTEKTITIINHGSGTPVLKNMYDYNTVRYNTTAPNGKRKGLICVKRFTGLDATGRDAFVKIIKQTIGRNLYSQSLRQYVYTKHDGKYYSDCSSLGMATLQRVGFDIDLLNTAGIYMSKLFVSVPVKIENGHITNPEILKVGDCLLYRGNDSSRPLQIGHVAYVYDLEGVKKSSKPKQEDVTANDKLLQITADTLDGKYGNGEARKKNLGNNYKAVQNLINHINNATTTALAKEVIDGKYGDNPMRKKLLGSRYKAVQKKVNELI